jgi:hypothetical protein
VVPLVCTCLLEVKPKLRPPKFWRPISQRNSPGSFTKFTAIFRASSQVSAHFIVLKYASLSPFGTVWRLSCRINQGKTVVLYCRPA